MLKKFCPHPGCGKLINQNESACEEHKRHYDTTVRKSASNKQFDDFYHSTGWRIARQMAIARDNGLCVECLKENTVTVFHNVHHIIPLKAPGGWRHRFDIDNLVCLCEKHHKIADLRCRGL